MNTLSSMRWISLQHLLRLILTLITALGLARVLGPALYGEYQSILSWILLFAALGAGGFQSVVVQVLATHSNPEIVLGTALRLRTAFTGLALLLSTALPKVLGMDPSMNMGILLMSPILILQNADLIDYLYLAKSNPKPAVLARIAGLITAASAFAYGFYTHQGLHFFMIAFWSEHLITALAMLWINHRSGVAVTSWKFDPNMAAELWKQSWPILVSTFFYFVSLRLDVLMLHHMTSSHESGLYAAASRLSQLWAFLPLMMVNAVFPNLARMKEQSHSAYLQGVQSLLFLIGTSAWAIALPLSLLASTLIPLFLGQDYVATIPLLQIQAWITLAYFLRTGLDRWLVQERLTLYNMIFHILTALTNVVLNLCLIPLWGALGATISSLVALSLGLAVYPWLFKATRPLAQKTSLALIAPIFLLFKSNRNNLRHLLSQ